MNANQAILNRYLQGVARLFRKGETVSREDFTRRVDMDAQTPEHVRRLFHQVEFDQVAIDLSGRIAWDGARFSES